MGTLEWDRSPFGLYDMGGNPGELAKEGDRFVIKADCMCNRRFCTHGAWTQVDYGKNQVKDNWAFRYVMPASVLNRSETRRKP